MRKKKFTQHYFSWKIAEKEKSQVVISTIRHVLKFSSRIGKPIKDLVVLDVGSGTGQYSFEIGKRVKKVIGVEPFRDAYLSALKKKKIYNVGDTCVFKNIPVEKIDTKMKFDLALCLATLEHMPNAEASFKKIFDLLNDGGMIYLTVPNKLWPYEYHYRLWFLSWFPLPYANLYVRMMNRGKSFEDSAYAKSFFGIKKFFNKFPCTYEFIIPDPEEEFLGQGDTSLFYTLIKNTGLRLLKRFSSLLFISKAFLVVITKQTKV